VKRPSPPLESNHFDASGRAHMVHVGAKPEVPRAAQATSVVRVSEGAAKMIAAGKVGKGDVLGVARLAGLQAVKRTADLIPLCHPLRIVGSELALELRGREVHITATVHAIDRTGVEMEALTAASIAALTVYDMCKGVDPKIQILRTKLSWKSKGQPLP
jgi:cyclic pyranopterin monophosphate synthase